MNVGGGDPLAPLGLLGAHDGAVARGCEAAFLAAWEASPLDEASAAAALGRELLAGRASTFLLARALKTLPSEAARAGFLEGALREQEDRAEREEAARWGRAWALVAPGVAHVPATTEAIAARAADEVVAALARAGVRAVFAPSAGKALEEALEFAGISKVTAPPSPRGFWARLFGR